MSEPNQTLWPTLNYSTYRKTGEALHLWSQIIGKLRLASTPWINHSWHATLYVTPRGLSTGLFHQDAISLSVELDFQDHCLVAVTGTGQRKTMALEDMSVATFHDRLREMIHELGGTFDIHGAPNEIPDGIAFAQDTTVRPYSTTDAAALHQALVQIERVFSQFRTGFLGKVSPVHLFWGSFDLAVTRFSGRTAPRHPGGIPKLPDAITWEAYSHEVSSAGFWPGGGGIDEAMFYSYAYPVPEAFHAQSVKPAAARWDDGLGEFLLPYEAVRTSDNPAETLLAFLNSTYEAAASTAGWDREALECGIQKARVPRPVDEQA
ncbi:MAG: DUF5996 family protein [Pseudomonadota bacterium]